MPPLLERYVGDAKSRILAERLRQAAEAVLEPQRSQIMERLLETIFVSHTSLDDAVLLPHILPIIRETCSDPFFHSKNTDGGMFGVAREYEKIVGLSLLSSHRVLSIWSKNAAEKSDYFLAEQHLAMSESKSIVSFCIDAGFYFHNKMLSQELIGCEICAIDASEGTSPLPIASSPCILAGPVRVLGVAVQRATMHVAFGSFSTDWFPWATNVMSACPESDRISASQHNGATCQQRPFGVAAESAVLLADC